MIGKCGGPYQGKTGVPFVGNGSSRLGPKLHQAVARFFYVENVPGVPVPSGRGSGGDGAYFASEFSPDFPDSVRGCPAGYLDRRRRPRGKRLLT